MPQANSQTSLVNKALTLVGAATVTSINDGTPSANAISNVYEIALQSILSECKWNFCTSRATLTLVYSVSSSSGTAPISFLYPNERFIYQLPELIIRIHDVFPQWARWREESGQVISDTANLGILYTYYDDNPNDYPSYFLDAFTDKLCADIAYNIVNSASLGDSFFKKYQGVTLTKAISANSQTGIQQNIEDTAWERAKYQDINVDS